LKGADAAYNAKVARAVFAGERGPVRDTVLLNAAAGVAAFEGPDADGLVDQLRAAIARCAAAIDDGAAAAKLDDWVDASQLARPAL
jgi:anthranilate phosphoribosyltransferase